MFNFKRLVLCVKGSYENILLPFRTFSLKSFSWFFWLNSFLFLFFLLCFCTFIGFGFSLEEEGSTIVRPGEVIPIDYVTLAQVPRVKSWDEVLLVMEGPGKGRIFNKAASLEPFMEVRMPNNVIVTMDVRMAEMMRMLEQTDGYIDISHPETIGRLRAWEALDHERRMAGGFGAADPDGDGPPRRSPFFWPVVGLAFVGTFLLLMWWDGDIRFFKRKA